MIRTRFAMAKTQLDSFLELQAEIYQSMRSMSAQEMREVKAEIYEAATINRTPSKDQNDVELYKVDENSAAHIPVTGILTPEVNPCAALFGDNETEYGFISAAIDTANSDPKIDKIILEIDSPGGYVDGIDGAAAAIAESEKEVIAVVNNMAASAAYWIASQASQIIASGPSAQVGSIGVAISAVDVREAEEMEGVKRYTFTSTDAPDKRLDVSDKEDQKKIIAELDDIHLVFAKKVAAGRGVDVKTVNKDFGQGGLVIASKALKAGMIDKIIDYDVEKIGVADSKPASDAGNKKEVPKNMNKEQLRQEHPDLYAQIEKENREAGVKQERERVAELRSYTEADPENTKLAEVIDQAIADGSTVSQVNAKIQVAIRDGKALDGENPPQVSTEETGEQLSAEERELIKNLGISEEEYRNSKEAE